MSDKDLTTPASSLALPAPAERLLVDGGSALTDAELLTVLLVAEEAGENVLELAEGMLAANNGLHGLAHASAADLRQVTGLTEPHLAQILAGQELCKRLLVGDGGQPSTILTAADAVRCVGDMSFLRQENVRVILLDSAQRVIGIQTIYIGTVNTSVLRIAEVFRDALIRNSPAIILAHNHPSGDPTPSPEDVEVTQSVANAGRLLDIALLDHIILSHQGWVSLRDLGITF